MLALSVGQWPLPWGGCSFQAGPVSLVFFAGTVVPRQLSKFVIFTYLDFLSLRGSVLVILIFLERHLFIYEYIFIFGDLK